MPVADIRSIDTKRFASVARLALERHGLSLDPMTNI